MLLLYQYFYLEGIHNDGVNNLIFRRVHTLENSNVLIKGDNKYAVLGMGGVIKNIAWDKSLSHTIAVYFFENEAKNIESNSALLTLSFTPVIIVCSDRLYHILSKLPTAMNKLVINIRDKIENIIKSITNYIVKFNNAIYCFSLKDYKKWCARCIVISAGELVFIKYFMDGKCRDEIIAISKLSWQRIYAMKKSIKEKTGARTDIELYYILNSISLYISMLNAKIVSIGEYKVKGNIQ